MLWLDRCQCRVNPNYYCEDDFLFAVIVIVDVVVVLFTFVLNAVFTIILIHIIVDVIVVIPIVVFTTILNVYAIGVIVFINQQHPVN